MFAQTARLQSVSSFVTILLFLGSGACLCKAQEQGQALGELKLEGKYIERLLLRRNDGRKEVINDPEETVKLPVGQYLLKDVRLRAGQQEAAQVQRQAQRRQGFANEGILKKARKTVTFCLKL